MVVSGCAPETRRFTEPGDCGCGCHQCTDGPAAPGPARIENPAGGFRQAARRVELGRAGAVRGTDDRGGYGAGDRVRERGEPAAGAGGGPPKRDRDETGGGREPRKTGPAASDGKRAAVLYRRGGGIPVVVL